MLSFNGKSDQQKEVIQHVETNSDWSVYSVAMILNSTPANVIQPLDDEMRLSLVAAGKLIAADLYCDLQNRCPAGVMKGKCKQCECN